MKALQISGVSFSYDGALNKAVDHTSEYALHDYNLEVEAGHIHALLGPNGAGKTTLMRVITGHLRNYAGDVTIFGTKLPNRDILHSIGYAPQPISLFSALTGNENLHFFGVMAGLSEDQIRQRSQEVLVQTGLIEYAGKKVANYSGGMLRRLNLAVALLHSPRLLLLDEPTVGVDPQSRHHIYEALLNLNGSGMTILLSTHIMDEAQRLCASVTLMDKGSVVFAGDMAGIDNLEEFFLEKTGHGLRDECA